VIQMLLGLKQVYRLPLRALQGFAHSLRELAFADLPVPNYTTLSRRAQDLKVRLPALRSGEPLHLVVDSTGVKLYGEGEWKVRKHGYSKRRTWRKVHLGLDAKTGQVCAALMTHQDVADADVLPKLLDQIPADEPIDTIGGDGAYDTKQCHAAIAARDAQPSIPPREGAMPWSENTPGASWRNEAIDAIARSGRQEWKKRSGYHRRSLVENLMYRLKTLTGTRLWARCSDPRGRAEPHDGARTPAVHPHRMNSGSQKPSCPYVRLMQQRPGAPRSNSHSFVAAYPDQCAVLQRNPGGTMRAVIACRLRVSY
jgi:hypothetical protein